jgi:hypothetical protein
MLSRAPEIKRALYTGLKTALDGDSVVTVHLGTPPPETNAYEYVIVGPEDTPTEIEQEWRGFGAGATRTEHVDLPIQVKVFKDGQHQTLAEDRSWEIAGAVDDLITARTLEVSGTVFGSLPARLTQTTETFTDGHTSTITLTVHCEAVTSST